jgi:hypothetical protein
MMVLKEQASCPLRRGSQPNDFLLNPWQPQRPLKGNRISPLSKRIFSRMKFPTHFTANCAENSMAWDKKSSSTDAPRRTEIRCCFSINARFRRQEQNCCSAKTRRPGPSYRSDSKRSVPAVVLSEVGVRRIFRSAHLLTLFPILLVWL